MEKNQHALSEVLAPPPQVVRENDVDELHEDNMEGGKDCQAELSRMIVNVNINTSDSECV